MGSRDSHFDREAIKAVDGVADKVGLHGLNGNPDISQLGSAAVCKRVERVERVERRDICRVLNDKAEMVAR
jgi:hypothetical protein